MTSSYNISRRPKNKLLSPINWDAQQKHIGVCPPGYITVPITQGDPSNPQCSDWKFCVPQKNKEGMPASYPEIADMVSCVDPHVKTRHFFYNLYNHPAGATQSRTNWYPPGKRRTERRNLDKEDYFRLPLKFDGTGYHPTRSWAYPEFATDHIDLPNEWSPFHLIQRKDAQEQAKRELKQRREESFVPYTKPYLGTFYKTF